MPVTNNEQLLLQGEIKNPFPHVWLKFVTICFHKAENLTSPNRMNQISSTFWFSDCHTLVFNVFIVSNKMTCLPRDSYYHERNLMVEFCSYIGCSLTGYSEILLRQYNRKWWSRICQFPIIISILAFYLVANMSVPNLFELLWNWSCFMFSVLPFTSSSSTVVLLLSDDSWRPEIDSQFGFKHNNTHICAEYTWRQTS